MFTVEYKPVSVAIAMFQPVSGGKHCRSLVHEVFDCSLKRSVIFDSLLSVIGIAETKIIKLVIFYIKFLTFDIFIFNKESVQALDFPERNNRFKRVKKHGTMYMYTRVNTRFHLA